MDGMWFKFGGTFFITKDDVFSYFEANDIEYEPDITEPTMEDYQAAAESYAETESLEMSVELCV